jgi:hypothetical protein
MWFISSRTNSPAAVVGRFPRANAAFARFRILFSGITSSLRAL